ncbi:MAG: flagellar biosynthesis regulator FlhF [Hyphomicrobiales bacterium]|nr:flagellar biosynthesis regulator FlhF [Hyphomicrobiales bacterium]
MAQARYAEIVADDGANARRTEFVAISNVIDALGAVAGAAIPSFDALTTALDMHDALWSIFLEDLAGDGNLLPLDLRASLISIGLWAVKESANARLGGDLKTLIEVNSIVRDGLGR